MGVGGVGARRSLIAYVTAKSDCPPVLIAFLCHLL